MTKRQEERWFSRGKSARSRGQARTLSDGRVSLAAKKHFYHGWDEQDRFMQPPPTPQQTAEAIATIAQLKAWAADQRAPS